MCLGEQLTDSDRGPCSDGLDCLDFAEKLDSPVHAAGILPPPFWRLPLAHDFRGRRVKSTTQCFVQVAPPSSERWLSQWALVAVISDQVSRERTRCPRSSSHSPNRSIFPFANLPRQT